jgi:hypothetical protein
LPGIRYRLAILVEGLAPILTLVVAATRRIFPLRFGRKLAAEPVCIGERILVRMIFALYATPEPSKAVSRLI